MSETHNTNTVTATLPIAMHAITAHMIDRALPAPWMILTSCDRREVTAHVHDRDLDTWLDSVVVDAEDYEPVKGATIGHHARYTARIPSGIGEVRIVIAAVRATPGLQVVSA